MSFVAVAVATVAVGTALYSANQQKKAGQAQLNAAREAADQQAKAQAQAETDAANAANARIAETKRRRRSVLGAAQDDTLGAPAGATSRTPGSALGGAAARTAGGSAGVSYGGTPLGSAGAIFAGGAKNWRNEAMGN
jgi:hypothetical protein